MNSVDKHLNAETKAATLLAMRSAKKDTLLVVEGDTDVDLFANTLGVPRSNILSCNGKEVLMLVYGMGPAKGIDPGSIFIRDRDHDSVITGIKNGVLILVTTKYDIEMELLGNRIFGRLLSDYLKSPLDRVQESAEFAKVCRPAGYIGALRLFSHTNAIGIDFDDIKYTRFINAKTMDIGVKEMVRYMFAKSKVKLENLDDIQAEIEKLVLSVPNDEMACGKEVVDVLHLALSKHYDACPASECTSEVLSRMLRVAANNDDMKMLPMYAALRAHVASSGFPWNGAPL